MTADESWRSRWRDVLVDGFSHEADLRWFTGAGGFLAFCRASPADQLRRLLVDGRFDDVVAELDDRMIHFPGSPPSARATALVEVALAAGPHAIGSSTRAAFMPAGAGIDDPTLTHQVDAAVGELWKHLSSDQPVDLGATVSVPIVVSHHAHGDVVEIEVRRSSFGQLGPDLVAAPFQRIDATFARSIHDAATALGVTTGVRYSARSRRTGLAVDAIGGPSGGLGAAVAVRRLVTPSAPLDPEWAFTGAIDEYGAVLPLSGPDRSADYQPKLLALDKGTLVYPARDRTEVERQGSTQAPGVRLEGVSSLDEVERLLARHIEGGRAYQRALVSQRNPRVVWALAAPALLIGIVALAALWGNRSRESAVDTALRHQAAPLAPFTIEVPDAATGAVRRFQVDRTEVSNSQYAACVEARICSPVPDALEARGGSEPANAGFPVTGVPAAQAEIFCHYARGEGWTLPTHEQYVDLIAEGVSYEYPFGQLELDDRALAAENLPATIQPVNSDALGAGNMSWVTGNVAEWTRTKCTDTGCVALDSLEDSPLVALRVVGLSYDLFQNDDWYGALWITDPELPDFLISSRAHQPFIGFRCATPSAVA